MKFFGWNSKNPPHFSTKNESVTDRKKKILRFNHFPVQMRKNACLAEADVSVLVRDCGIFKAFEIFVSTNIGACIERLKNEKIHWIKIQNSDEKTKTVYDMSYF